MQEHIDSLQQVIQTQQGDILDMTSFMTTISTSLDSISATQGMLTILTPEGTTPTKKELKQRLNDFGQLVDRQRQQIAALRQQLEKSNSEHADQMRKLLANYETQLQEKDAEIDRLKTFSFQLHIMVYLSPIPCLFGMFSLFRCQGCIHGTGSWHN